MEIIEGTIPVLVTVPHIRVRRRFKHGSIMYDATDTEHYTPDIAKAIKRMCDVWIITNGEGETEEDANHPRGRYSEFRKKISEIIKEHSIKVVIDLHGAAEIGIMGGDPRISGEDELYDIGSVQLPGERQKGRRPDIDIEFRRRCRTLPCTMKGSHIIKLRERFIELGFIVGVEAIFPGGDIIGYHSHVDGVEAVALELVDYVRNDTTKHPFVAAPIARWLNEVYGFTVNVPSDIPETQLPELDELIEQLKKRMEGKRTDEPDTDYIG